MPPKEVICVFCGKGFKTQLAARMHENQHHGPSGPSGEGGGGGPDGSKARNDYQCPVCRRDFDTKAQAQRHMLRIHSDNSRSFICEQCGKGFKVRRGIRSTLVRFFDSSHENYSFSLV